jgi:hypothetical protein
MWPPNPAMTVPARTLPAMTQPDGCGPGHATVLPDAQQGTEYEWRGRDQPARPAIVQGVRTLPLPQ